MSATGNSTEVIRGANNRLQIGTNRWDLKRAVNLHLGSNTYKDSTSLGYIKHQGQRDDYMTVEVYISEPDISTLVGLANVDSNGNPTSSTITLTMTAVGGGSGTISGTGYVASVDVLDDDPENKLYAVLNIEFTGTVSGT